MSLTYALLADTYFAITATWIGSPTVYWMLKAQPLITELELT